MIRTIPPPPPEFAELFAQGGWEKVELFYGARTDLIRKWIRKTGATCRFPRKRNIPSIVSNIGTE